MRPIWLVLMLSSVASAQADRREIPVPPVRTRLPWLPAAGQLPVVEEMPDILRMNDGTRVTTPAQWRKRRAEMRRTLEYYAVGRMPPAPGNVRGEEISRATAAGGAATYRLIRLTFGRTFQLHIGLLTPSSGGPFPAVILLSGTPPGAPHLPRLPNGPNQGKGENVLLLVGPAPDPKAPPQPPRPFPGAVTTPEAAAERYAAVLRRGYAIAMFNPNDCAEDTTLRNLDGSWAFRNTRFPAAYPDYDWGILGAWAWGASRVADYLERDKSIDRTWLIVTGASRYGKASMVAAAFDDRLMGAPVVTGGGGVGAYRFAGPRNSETLDIMLKKYPNWFSPHLHQFRGQRERLPFDQHWFVALTAPRPFIALEGISDAISLPEAVRQTIDAARPAYELLGAADRAGVNYAPHGHTFNADDWTALMDFADKHLRGLPVDRAFDRYPTERELDEARKPR
jgi:hypothetical protein